MRSRLRGLRDADGNLMYADLRQGVGSEMVFGANLQVVKNGVWDDAEAYCLVADKSKLVCALREDLTYKVLTEATVGGINLAEKDMVALRVKMRLGWEVATNATRLASDPVPYAVVAADIAS
jgi:HK97 family phage major capsid protein